MPTGAMELATPAIVCAVRAHGEHGAIARLMTPEAGLLAGYVRGGRSRRLRPVLMHGNGVAARFRARTADQLAALTVELAHSRAGLLTEPLPAAAIDWITALTARALPEGQPYPAIHAALAAMLDAIEFAPSARVWAESLARFEALLIGELGYGAALAPTHDLGRAFVRNRDALALHLLIGPRDEALLAARERLIERIARAVAAPVADGRAKG